MSTYQKNRSTDFGGEFDYAHALGLQADGKIVVAGYEEVYPYGNSNNDFAIARYNIDGSLDTTFGSGGKITTDFGSGEVINDIDIQFNGKIVVAGEYWNGTSSAFISARYNIDGSLDPAFGAGGKVITDSLGLSSVAYAVDIQADGKIVVAGSAYTLNIGVPSPRTTGSTMI